MGAPRGSSDNPIYIDALQKGDVPGNPIQIDDYNWDPNWAYTDIEPVSGSESELEDGDSSDAKYQAESSSFDHYSCPSDSENSVVDDSETDNIPANPLLFFQSRRRASHGARQKQFYSWMRIKKQSSSLLSNRRAVISGFTSSKLSSNAGNKIFGDRGDYRGSGPRSYIETTRTPGSNLSDSGRSFAPPPKRRRILSESPFIVPIGEESLWRDPAVCAEEAREEEMIEHYLFDDNVHLETNHTPQQIARTSGSYTTNLPLDSFIGDFTLERHAAIEPESVEFRREIVQRELAYHDRLKIGGAACAEEMMRRLGVYVSGDTSDLKLNPSSAGKKGKKRK